MSPWTKNGYSHQFFTAGAFFFFHRRLRRLRRRHGCDGGRCRCCTAQEGRGLAIRIRLFISWKMGIPNKLDSAGWFICLFQSPKTKWMITGGTTHDLGNLQIGPSPAWYVVTDAWERISRWPFVENWIVPFFRMKWRNNRMLATADVLEKMAMTADGCPLWQFKRLTARSNGIQRSLLWHCLPAISIMWPTSFTHTLDDQFGRQHYGLWQRMLLLPDRDGALRGYVQRPPLTTAISKYIPCSKLNMSIMKLTGPKNQLAGPIYKYHVKSLNAIIKHHEISLRKLS